MCCTPPQRSIPETRVRKKRCLEKITEWSWGMSRDSLVHVFTGRLLSRHREKTSVDNGRGEHSSVVEDARTECRRERGGCLRVSQKLGTIHLNRDECLRHLPLVALRVVSSALLRPRVLFSGTAEDSNIACFAHRGIR